LESLPLADGDPEVREFLRRDYGFVGISPIMARLDRFPMVGRVLFYPGKRLDWSTRFRQWNVSSARRPRKTVSMMFLFGGGGLAVYSGAALT
jgi:hypothetical protein